MDQGVHALDLCRWFLGDFEEVFGYVATSYWTSMEVEDNVFCLLRTQANQIADVHASWTQWKNLFLLEIFGKEGYCSAEGLGGSYGTERATIGKRDFSRPFEENVVEFRGNDSSWLDEWKEFTSAIAEDRQPLGNGHDGLEAVRLAYAVYDSSAQKRVVALHRE